ncbi:hypothetical protein [Amycolatopsis sp. M39]|uniref:hypothetical protein n=1 Tax=Amycolatopsis sp. M39 TaxID=1825094 RepID=UPI0007E21680|nr:hypothetical protein [Amycolatopsis sp. M39]OAP19931.1 hypothetical protein A4R44_09335 [Amycolatopsis sp. M39]
MLRLGCLGQPGDGVGDEAGSRVPGSDQKMPRLVKGINRHDDDVARLSTTTPPFSGRSRLACVHGVLRGERIWAGDHGLSRGMLPASRASLPSLEALRSSATAGAFVLGDLKNLTRG